MSNKQEDVVTETIIQGRTSFASGHNGSTLFAVLPLEIICHICGYLSLQEALILRFVSKNWLYALESTNIFIDRYGMTVAERYIRMHKQFGSESSFSSVEDFYEKTIRRNRINNIKSFLSFWFACSAFIYLFSILQIFLAVFYGNDKCKETAFLGLGVWTLSDGVLCIAFNLTCCLVCLWCYIGNKYAGWLNWIVFSYCFMILVSVITGTILVAESRECLEYAPSTWKLGLGVVISKWILYVCHVLYLPFVCYVIIFKIQPTRL
mmetsp:Transcript_18404/g.20458  ORF Transcript_18404/g.20458 Transcript_18404/m.20458 type:complete len:264 (+) Transcript_18404:140-931(+)